MPVRAIRVPVPRYRQRLPRPYPMAPPPAGNLTGLIGGLAGLLMCLLCLTAMGLLGLFATFIAVTAYLGQLYSALKSAGGDATGLNVNMFILLAALCFASFLKLQRSL